MRIRARSYIQNHQHDSGLARHKVPHQPARDFSGHVQSAVNGLADSVIQKKLMLTARNFLETGI